MASVDIQKQKAIAIAKARAKANASTQTQTAPQRPGQSLASPQNDYAAQYTKQMQDLSDAPGAMANFKAGVGHAMDIPIAMADIIPYLTKGGAYAQSLRDGTPYEDELAKARAAADFHTNRSGLPGFIAQMVGLGGAVDGLQKLGITATNIPKLPALIGSAIDGTAISTLDALGHDKDSLKAALYGAGGGALGHGVAKLGENLIERSRPAVEQAANRVRGIIDGMKGSPNAVASRVDDLGSEAMLIDAMGERGGALGRYVANISPDAREALQAALRGRSGGQNQRLVDDLAEASGLPTGVEKSISGYKTELLEQAKPSIDKAYNAVRDARMPLAAFKDVLQSPDVRRAYFEGVKNVKNRAIAEGRKPERITRLSVMDEAKRVLDGRANVAYRAGDSASGSVSAALAKRLRETTDDALGNGGYAYARTMRKAAYDRDDAVQLGADLATGKITADELAKASGAKINKDLIGKGYAIQQSENLLNKRNTVGALNSMSTPRGKAAYESALSGQGVDRVNKGLARERTFNKSEAAITGNSSTARQLAEIVAGGGIGMGGAMAAGQDWMTGGIAGLAMGAGRRAIPAIQSKIASKRNQAMAPHIADLLTRGVIPQASKLTQKQKATLDAIRLMLTTGAVAAN